MSSYLWQNFLHDGKYQKKIVWQLSYFDFDEICEIWPWKWAITSHLLKRDTPLVAIEKDNKLYAWLEAQWISLIKKDALTVTDEEITKDPSRTMIIGNLPYYITSPLLRHFFQWKPRRVWWVCMIQKEVADKISHDAPKKSFLRWLLNYWYTVHYCFSVPPAAFSPAPKVTSAVVRLVPRSVFPHMTIESLLIILDLLSIAKRKTLGKIAKIHQKKWVWLLMPEHLQGLRLEQLWWDEMEEIVDFNKELTNLLQSDETLI